jgi:transcriptional regulator with XRE-family HTH domain
MPTSSRPPGIKRVLLQLLRQSREAAGVSQGEMAAALSLRQPDISKIERGVRNLEALEMLLWARAVGTRFEAFAGVLDEQWDRLEGTDRYLSRTGH